MNMPRLPASYQRLIFCSLNMSNGRLDTRRNDAGNPRVEGSEMACSDGLSTRCNVETFGGICFGHIVLCMYHNFDVVGVVTEIALDTHLVYYT